MKLKSLFLILISLLITSCNVNSNKSEEIYYLDGLASNLFVYDVMEEYMEFTYVKETDSYHLYVRSSSKVGIYSSDELGYKLNGKDIIIPNVYDDGIHGFKRVKSFDIQDSSVGYINSLTVSEGIIECGRIIQSRIINFYLPTSVIKMENFYDIYDSYFSYYSRVGIRKEGIFDLKFVYLGTTEQFNKIVFSDVPINIYPEMGSIIIECSDGEINKKIYSAPYVQ